MEPIKVPRLASPMHQGCKASGPHRRFSDDRAAEVPVGLVVLSIYYKR